jgi:FtsH-binding integral membrane protein
MILFRSLPEATDPAQAADLGFLVISVSLVTGITAAIAAGWFLTRALADTWRRAVVGALSVFGTVLLAALTMPADMVGGRPALTIYLVVLIAAVTYTRHAALRAASR